MVIEVIEVIEVHSTHRRLSPKDWAQLSMSTVQCQHTNRGVLEMKVYLVESDLERFSVSLGLCSRPTKHTLNPLSIIYLVERPVSLF